MSDELIRVPAFLATETGDCGIMPMCDFCAEVACETAAMTCGQCGGQSCASQCAVSECSVAQCGQCGIAETGCGPQCFQCGTCESCQSSECRIGECVLCETGQCGACQHGQCGSCESGQCGSCESSSQTVYTAPTFTITNITENGCDVNVRPGSGYVRYRVFARLTSDPYDKSYDWTFETTSAFTATMDSLQPRTGYTVNVCGVIDTVSDKWAGEKTFTTGGKTRPPDWEWWSTVAPDKPINLSADEWNDFYVRIDAFRKYTGRDPWPNYKPVGSGTEISAAIVNEVRAAINPMGPTDPLPKYINPGDPITADYFNSLKDFLNSVP